MNQNLIFFPCLAMLVLTVLVLLRMFFTRVSAVRSGSVDFRYFKTYNTNENGPAIMHQAARNFTNLFEVPTLFYMLCLFALVTRSVDQIFLWAAWLYVVLRYIHSFIHVTSNKIGPRMGVYTGSWIVLVIMAAMVSTKIAGF